MDKSIESPRFNSGNLVPPQGEFDTLGEVAEDVCRDMSDVVAAETHKEEVVRNVCRDGPETSVVSPEVDAAPWRETAPEQD